MSKSICPKHGINNGTCPKCAALRTKLYDKHQRNKDNQKIYNSKRWRDMSKLFLKNNPLCIECAYPAELTDHIEEISDGGSEYDWENLQPMCIKCHNAKTSEARKQRGGGVKSLKPKSQNTEPPTKFLEKPVQRGTP